MASTHRIRLMTPPPPSPVISLPSSDASEPKLLESSAPIPPTGDTSSDPPDSPSLHLSPSFFQSPPPAPALPPLISPSTVFSDTSFNPLAPKPEPSVPPGSPTTSTVPCSSVSLPDGQPPSHSRRLAGDICRDALEVLTASYKSNLRRPSPSDYRAFIVGLLTITLSVQGSIGFALLMTGYGENSSHVAFRDCTILGILHIVLSGLTFLCLLSYTFAHRLFRFPLLLIVIISACLTLATAAFCGHYQRRKFQYRHARWLDRWEPEVLHDQFETEEVKFFNQCDRVLLYVGGLSVALLPFYLRAAVARVDTSSAEALIYCGGVGAGLFLSSTLVMTSSLTAPLGFGSTMLALCIVGIIVVSLGDWINTPFLHYINAAVFALLAGLAIATAAFFFHWYSVGKEVDFHTATLPQHQWAPVVFFHLVGMGGLCCLIAPASFALLLLSIASITHSLATARDVRLLVKALKEHREGPYASVKASGSFGNLPSSHRVSVVSLRSNRRRHNMSLFGREADAASAAYEPSRENSFGTLTSLNEVGPKATRLGPVGEAFVVK